MNQTIKNFLERNNINADEVPEDLASKIINKQSFVTAIKEKNTSLIDEVEQESKANKSFRQFFVAVFPEIDEDEIVPTMEKIKKEITFRNIDLSNAQDLEDVMDKIDSNANLLKDTKIQFEKFTKVVETSSDKINKCFKIMGFEKDPQKDIKNITNRFENVVSEVDKMMDTAYESDDSKAYDKAESAIKCLAKLDFSKWNKTYHSFGITELEEKISDKAVKLQTQARIDMLEEKKTSEQNKKFSLLDKLRGKQRLRDATVKNLELQEEYVKSQADTSKPMTEAVRDLYNYTKVYKSTPEIDDYMTKLKTLDKATNFIDMDKICIEGFLPVQRKTKWVSPRKKAAKIEAKNTEMEREAQTERPQQHSKSIKTEGNDKQDRIINTILIGIQSAENTVQS